MNKESIQNSPLSKKERINVMMQRADAEWKDMDGRRIYEWRVSFGLWTGTAALAGLLLNRDPKLPPLAHPYIVAGMLCLAGFVYTFWWTKGLRERGILNLNTAHYFWNEVEKEIGTQSPSKKCRDENKVPPETIYFHWASGSQVLITWVIIIIALHAIVPWPCSVIASVLIVIIMLLMCLWIDKPCKVKEAA